MTDLANQLLLNTEYQVAVKFKKKNKKKRIMQQFLGLLCRPENEEMEGDALPSVVWLRAPKCNLFF